MVPGKRRWTDYEKKQRLRCLVRDNFKCQAHKLGLCKKRCGEHPVDQLEVHHKIFVINGGDSSLENLLTLCIKHHDQLHPWRKKLVRGMKKELPGMKKEF